MRVGVNISPKAGLADALLNESILYLAAATAALALDMAVYSSLIHWGGIFYQWAAGFGFLAGLGLIYVLSVRLVFRHRASKDKRKEFLIFCGIGFLGLGLNGLILHMAVSELHSPFELAKIISAALVFVFNFSIRKALLFSKEA